MSECVCVHFAGEIAKEKFRVKICIEYIIWEGELCQPSL